MYLTVIKTQCGTVVNANNFFRITNSMLINPICNLLISETFIWTTAVDKLHSKQSSSCESNHLMLLVQLSLLLPTFKMLLTSGANTKVCMNFLIGCPLFVNSPMTCTTTPSFSVAWASTWRILVRHSLNCRDITFLWMS